MTDSKKRRMSMLDSLSAAGSPAPPASMMSSNRALRAARDAVDSHNVWELDPRLIEDARLADRLHPEDVADLRDAIEANGQTVPILVRRHPSVPDRYLLVYGRRRLEAIRQSDKVDKVRALIATLDDDAALRSQISENMARQDLSFIEKALFAQELVENGFGNQARVAEVLTVTKSSVSMAISIAEAIGRDLALAIGPAHGIGRPRWETLARAIDENGISRDSLIEIAERVHTDAAISQLTEDAVADGDDVSARAFEAVLKAVAPRPAPRASAASRSSKVRTRPLRVDGVSDASVRRTSKGVALEIGNGAFSDWIEREAESLLEELHARWLKRAED